MMDRSPPQAIKIPREPITSSLYHRPMMGINRNATSCPITPEEINLRLSRAIPPEGGGDVGILPGIYSKIEVGLRDL